MSAFRVWKHRLPQGYDLEPLDRISGRDGSRLVEADVTSIDIRIFLIREKTAIYTATGLDPGSVTNPNNRVFDTLQTDGRWKPDTTGYNSRQTITQSDLSGQSAFLEGGKVYRVEITFNTSAWGEIVSVHEYTITPLWGKVS